MHLLAATEAAAFGRRTVMEQFVLVLRNFPLKRLAADALGEIELMGGRKGSRKRLCNFSWDIRAYQV
jgi:hypothetical protein